MQWHESPYSRDEISVAENIAIIPASRRDGIFVAKSHGADPPRPVRDGIF